MHFFFPATAKHRYSMLAILFAICALILFALKSVQPSAPPKEAATTEQFSLPAAQVQLQKITQDKHPIVSSSKAIQTKAAPKASSWLRTQRVSHLCNTPNTIALMMSTPNK